MTPLTVLWLGLLAGCDSDWCARFSLDCVVPAEVALPEVVDEDGDIWSSDEDCDDEDSGISPSAIEVCDGVDNNCDGVVDEGTPGIQDWPVDNDSDGYGDPYETREGCTPPTGTTTNSDDCDDYDASVNPARAEICDNDRDDDCDGRARTCAPSGTQRLASIGYTFGSGTIDDWMGHAIASGDLDADGYADLIVGLPSFDLGPGGGRSGRRAESDTGVPDSGTPDSGTPDPPDTGVPDAGGIYVLTGETLRALARGSYDLSNYATSYPGSDEGQTLGMAVASGIDVDGDGYDDVLIGSPGLSDDWGGAILLSGPVDSDADPYLVLSSELAGAEAGAAVGLFGGDTPALVVGLPGAEAVLTFAGPLSGSQSLQDRRARLQAPGLGGVVENAGDVNGDGVQDLLLTSPYEEAGTVWLLHGPVSAVADLDDAILVSGDLAGDRFGEGVATGDINGDGALDLIVGAPASNYGTITLLEIPKETGVTLYLDDAVAQIYSLEPGSRSGHSLHMAGDLDSDGASDLIVGAPGLALSSEGDSGGGAFLCYGPFTGTIDLARDARLTGRASGEQVGTRVLGDLDMGGDGDPDLVIGAPGDQTGQPGHLYIVPGRGM